MSEYSPSIEKLIESFERLPSIGHKTAARLAFYILNCFIIVVFRVQERKRMFDRLFTPATYKSWDMQEEMNIRKSGKCHL